MILERQTIQRQYLAKWKNRGLKYLGIKFAEDVQLMVQDDIGAMIDKIDKQLKQWIKLPLTWLGQISVLKMHVLPWLLFLFTYLNMGIPKKMILDLQWMINTFIWQSKKARVKTALMQQSIQQGGLNVPHMMNYYYATQLTALLFWWSKEWIDSWRLEQDGIVIPLIE